MLSNFTCINCNEVHGVKNGKVQHNKLSHVVVLKVTIQKNLNRLTSAIMNNWVMIATYQPFGPNTNSYSFAPTPHCTLKSLNPMINTDKQQRNFRDAIQHGQRIVIWGILVSRKEEYSRW